VKRALPVALLGALGGLSSALDLYAERPLSLPEAKSLPTILLLASILGAALTLVLLFLARPLLAKSAPTAHLERLLDAHRWTYLLALTPALGAFGLRIPLGTLLFLLGPAFLAWNLFLVRRVGQGTEEQPSAVFDLVPVLFFVSGMAALVYQVTWQRAMAQAFGGNIESVTVVVTVFMLGLGLGAQLGGRWSHRPPDELPRLFALCEGLVALFGLVSLPLIAWVGHVAAAHGFALTILGVTALLLLPTLLMGATLPLLVTFLHARARHVGSAVGLLYFVNTLGSAAACFVTADLLFTQLGQQGAVATAAALNLVVAASVFALRRASAPGARA